MGKEKTASLEEACVQAESAKQGNPPAGRKRLGRRKSKKRENRQPGRSACAGGNEKRRESASRQVRIEKKKSKNRGKNGKE
ncbi:MAG: hypothetical protein IJI10_10265 [Eubacterium sp.]|nr:hypothetical protein [Eubacterium sp.]